MSGVLIRPKGRGPFPAIVLNHGYIEPSIYVTGQGLAREQDALARAGFVVLHTDYRGHAASDPVAAGRPRDPARLHPRRRQRRRGAEEAAVRRRRTAGHAGPVDGRRGDHERAGHPAGAGRRGRDLRVSELAVPRQPQPLHAGQPPRGGRRLLRAVRYAAGGAAFLPRAVAAHVLRPDHRAGAGPPRHRRRHLPAAVGPHHPGADEGGRGRQPAAAGGRARTTPSMRAGRTRWTRRSGSCGSAWPEALPTRSRKGTVWA